MRRPLQAGVLLCLGGGLTGLVLTDGYLRYVRAVMGPPILAAGCILILVGFVSCRDLPDRRFARPNRSQPAQEAHHDGHSARIGWLLAAPIIAIVLVQPPALGVYSATHGNTGVADASGYQYPPLPAGDPVTLTIYDYMIRAVWGHGQGLAGRTIAVTGFATPGPHGDWSLTRLHISCCAADAWAYSVLIHGPWPAPAEGAWVTVTGRYVPLGGPATLNSVPVMTAVDLQTIPAPAQPYE